MQTKCHLSVLVHEQARKYGSRRALIYQDFGGDKWQSVSWFEFSEKVREVSKALLTLGVKEQENVGIFSQNSVQYLYTDFGIYGVRAVSIPLYATSSEQQIYHIIDDAQVRLLFVGEQEQYDKARRIFLHCHSLEKIVIYDNRVKTSSDDTYSIFFDEFLKKGAESTCQNELEELYEHANEDDLCNILYTSGTTGDSKGVMITYGQFHAALDVNDEVVHVSEEDRIVDFLPFTHILERGWITLCISEGSEIVINTDPKEIQQTMRDTHPTCMSAVPRFWEKLYSSVMDKIERAGESRKHLFSEALEIGRKHNIDYLSHGKRPPLSLRVKYNLVDRTLFDFVRREIGLEHPNIFPTAGATISQDIQIFVHSIGICMIAGYGLTESLATVSLTHKNEPFTVGSVGFPIRGLDVKIGDNEEILLKGPTITKGYYKRDELNKQSFDDDGYFHTGDAGYFSNGELFLKERIKDLFKTSNGKYIAPQMIESRLLVDKFIDQIAVIADDRKFVSALIVPDYQLLEEYARGNGILFYSRKSLCESPRIYSMMSDRISTLQQQLASYEKIKRFTLLPESFTIQNGELTNTLKVRRRVLSENYADVIDKMYKE
ncbi:MAG: long-chain fatty acid--CoA ligase [Prevotella sp.]|nr:long-chain fatty acid--CoA ligase [Prevotella sp.]